jgi:hypothetical protein
VRVTRRAVLALVLAAGLCVPVPALHVHADHDPDHHSLVHSHFSPHHSNDQSTSSLADHDGSAIYVQAAAAVPAAAHVSVPPVALITEPLARPAGAAAPFWFDHPIASVHDPPLSNASLRAPPLLSA